MRKAAAGLLVLFAGMVCAAQGFAGAQGGVQASASLDVAVRIPVALRFALTGQPQSVEVSAGDAATGEIVVSGTRLEFGSNDRHGLVLRAAVASPFREATIEGLGAPLRVTLEGLRVPMPPTLGGKGFAVFRLRYRLKLGAGVRPGRYAWPVALSMEAP